MADIPELSDDQWDELVERLARHAARKLYRLYWRGLPMNQGGAIPGGIEPGDLAGAAIEDLLSGTRHWDSDRYPDLLDFLKAVVDSKVNHLAESLENRTTRRLGPNRPGSEEQKEVELPAKSPNPSAAIAEEDAAQRLRAEIMSAIQEDDVARRMMACFERDITRPAEIAEELGVPVAEIYKAKKRLQRLVDSILQRWQRGKNDD